MKQEMRRDQHRLNREGDSLFEGLSLTPRQCDESLQSGDFRAEHRPAIRATRQCREDPVHARGSDDDGSQTRMRLRLGFSPFVANGPMTVTEPIHLFSLSLVDVVLRERLDEGIVDEPEAKRVIALGHGHADPLLGVRVEVDESRRLRLDLGGIGQLAVDPETQRHRRRVLGTLAWQSELELVVGIEIEAVRGFDVARIEPAEVLEAQAVLDFEGFGSATAAIAR